jgi:hypothetical protein
MAKVLFILGSAFIESFDDCLDANTFDVVMLFNIISKNK